jgi:hypothetical protein
VTTTVQPETSDRIIEAARASAPAETTLVAAPDAGAIVLIVTPEQAQASTDLWNACRDAHDAIKRKHKALRKPVEEALAKMKEMERDDLKPYGRAIELLAQSLLDWTDREAARVRAENEARLREAEERARADRQAQADAIRAAAAEAETAADRRALQQQAKQVAAAPVIPIVSAPPVQQFKTKGAHTQERWSAVVDDPAVLVASVIAGATSRLAVAPDQQWLDAQASALQGKFSIPGVRAVKTTGLVRGRRR